MSSKTTSNNPESADEIGYHIDKKLRERWNLIKDGKLFKVDEDRVYIVDGREGSGKSLFTLQQACYIDPTFADDPKRITFTPEATLSAIRNTKSDDKITKVIVFDEAFRGLSSRAALSKVNKRIIQSLMEMRQNNLVLFIVLPSFFMLDIYPALSRSNALFHIIKKKGSTLRSFHIYNYAKKAKLYNIGLKKGWNYGLYTKFNGRFYGKWPSTEGFKERYLKMKQEALFSMDDEPEHKNANITVKELADLREREQKVLLLYQKAMNLNNVALSKVAKAEVGLVISEGTVRNWRKKHGKDLETT